MLLESVMFWSIGLETNRDYFLHAPTSKPLLTIHQPMKPCPAPRPNKTESLSPNLNEIYPLWRKYEYGKTNIIPSALPHIRCPYSIQYMNLNSSIFIPLLTLQEVCNKVLSKHL